MPIGAGEVCFEKRANELDRQRRPDDSRAERQHVHRVVLDTLVRRERVVTEPGTDAGELVRGNGRADAASAQQHASLGASVEHGTRDAFGKVRIVVAGSELERAAVQRFVSGVANGVKDHRLETDAGMIRPDRDDHGMDATRFVAVWS